MKSLIAEIAKKYHLTETQLLNAVGEVNSLSLKTMTEEEKEAYTRLRELGFITMEEAKIICSKQG